MKPLRNYALLVLIGLAVLAPWPHAVANPPSCTSMPCGAYKNMKMSKGRLIKLSFYNQNPNARTNSQLYNCSWALTQGEYSQMGLCTISQLSSTSSTILLFPPGYDGKATAKKSGGLTIKCTKQQTPAQCAIATITVSLPTPPPPDVSGPGPNCNNPNGSPNCPPTNAPPQPSTLTVNVLSVVKNKSGILPKCEGCVDLKKGMNFPVFYQCFDPGCC